MIELINHLEFYTKQSKKKKISVYGLIKHCNRMGRGPFCSFRKGITGAGPPSVIRLLPATKGQVKS